ncbi:MAG: hypothetical protein R2856_14140 [Caldilineaceae bacterium]
MQTKQWYFNQESDWETIARLFDGAAADNTWQFQTPAQTGILADPSSLPLNGLPLVAIVEDDGEAAIETTVQLEGPPSVIQAASVTLFAQRGPDHTEAIDQGFSDRNGRIVVLGGRAGDEVRALSWNATYAGKVTLQAGVTNTLVMTTITPAARSADAQPYLRILPRSDGRSIDVRLALAPAGASLTAEFSHIDWQRSTFGSLTPTPSTGEMWVTLALNPPTSNESFFGLGALSVDGVDVANQPFLQMANLAFYSLLDIATQTTIASDGLFEVTLPQASIPQGIDNLHLLLAEQRIFGVEDGEYALSSAYQMQLSGAMTQFAQPVVVTLRYSGDEAEPKESIFVARYDETEMQWAPLPTTWSESAEAASAATNETGFFALFARAEPPPTDDHRIFLPGVSR